MTQTGFAAVALRWLKRIVLGLLALIALAAVLGAAYEFKARRDAHRNYPPPGQMVDIGGRKMHLDCRGEGSPTVILESGLDTNGSLAWDKVQDKLAGITRTCSYDRAGIMWSEPKTTPQDSDAVAQDLHATLMAAGVTGPLVLVCHSLGGPYNMSYTRLYPEQVKGLVFVDCSHPDQLERLPKTITETTKVPTVLKVLSALSWTGLYRLLPDMEIEGRPDRVKPIGRAYLGESLAANLVEMEAMPTSFEQGGALRDLGDRPLVVLTALEPIPQELFAAYGVPPEDGKQMQVTWEELNRDEASWSTRSRQQNVMDSQHYIQFQRPDLVVEAVQEVVDQVR